MRIGRKETDAVVGAAPDAGITLLRYRRHLRRTRGARLPLGVALGARRDEIVLAFQVRRAPTRASRAARRRPSIRLAVEDSLARDSAPTASTCTSSTSLTRRRRSPRPSARCGELVAAGRRPQESALGPFNFDVPAARRGRRRHPRRRPRLRQRPEPVQHPPPRPRGRCPSRVRAPGPRLPAVLPPRQRAAQRPAPTPRRGAASRGPGLAAMGDRAASQLTDERLSQGDLAGIEFCRARRPHIGP